jgi:hypothetical protein
MEQVASYKSSLLLNIILENTSTLQLITKIIKTESIYKYNKYAKLESSVGERRSSLINRWKKHKRIKREYLDQGRECLKAANI